MFGFSIGKLVVLAAVLVGVLIGFKLLGRSQPRERGSDGDSDAASRIDTVYDPETDSYVARDATDKSRKA